MSLTDDVESRYSADSGLTSISPPLNMSDSDDEDMLTLTYLVEKTPRQGLGIALRGSSTGLRGLYVADVPEASPCYNLLRKGDRIIKIDKFSLTRHSLTDAEVLSILRDRFQDDAEEVRITVARSPLIQVRESRLGPAEDSTLVHVEQPALRPRGSPRRLAPRSSRRASLNLSNYTTESLPLAAESLSPALSHARSQAMVMVEESPLLSDQTDGVLMASHEICQRCQAVQAMYDLPFCARHATNPMYMQAYHRGQLQSYPAIALGSHRGGDEAPPYTASSLSDQSPSYSDDLQQANVAERLLADGQVMVKQLKLEQAKRSQSMTSLTKETGHSLQPKDKEGHVDVDGCHRESNDNNDSNDNNESEADDALADSAWGANDLDNMLDHDPSSSSPNTSASTARSDRSSVGNAQAWNQSIRDDLASDLMAILNEIGQEQSTTDSLKVADKADSMFLTTEPEYTF